MAYITFYNPYYSAFRDENSNEAYNRVVRRFNSISDCNCGQGNVPAANITESDNEFRIDMALPGVEKKNIQVKHENGLLTISVEKPGEMEAKESYDRQEFDYYGSSRVFKTGDKVDSDKITARYDNGILSVVLPKREAYVKKPAQTISIA